MATTDRKYLSDTSWELKHRTGFDGYLGVHGGMHYETFENGFLDKCDSWAFDQSRYAYQYGSLGNLNWIGDVGTLVNKPGAHGRARAMDLTAVYHTGGFIDSNWSWREDLPNARKYLGMVAMCRRPIGNVLTAWYDSNHDNHVHIDDERAAGPISSGSTADTTLVQAACKYLNGASIEIDGVWNQETEDAYVVLLTTFDMKCLDPKTNSSHKNVFLAYITKHGFANKDAGYYTYGCD